MKFNEFRRLALEHMERAKKEGWWKDDFEVSRGEAFSGGIFGCPFWRYDGSRCACNFSFAVHPMGWCDIGMEYTEVSDAWKWYAQFRPEQWQQVVEEMGLKVVE